MKSKLGVAERFPILLLLIATLAIVLSHFDRLNFFDRQLNSLGMAHTWREWIALAPLSIFFYVAGLELRSEILDKRRALLIPTVGAIGGMLFPALIYIGIARGWGISDAAWGVPMATDLPLVLAAIALLPALQQRALRPFLLTLAIVDDGLSILIVAIKYHSGFHFGFLMAAVLSLFLFARLTRNASRPVIQIAKALTAILTWYFTARSGIHPTVAGVALGLLTFQINPMSVKKFWEPLSNYFVVPLFIFSIFAIQINFSWQSLSSQESLNIVIARVIGKPLGIVLFALIAAKVLRHALELSIKNLIFSGCLATLGLSVSLLFAQLSLSGNALSLAIVGVVVSIPVACVAIVGAYFLTRATAA